MDELTLEEMLRLAAKVEEWEHGPLGYFGSIDGITVTIYGRPGFFSNKTVKAEIDVKDYGDSKKPITLGEYQLSNDPDVLEAYEHAKKSYEERHEQEELEKRRKSLEKARGLIKQGE